MCVGGRPAVLGALADGRPVADALNAESTAVGPITEGDAAFGAITIVRGPDWPYERFGELHALSHVADLAAAAVARLRG